VERRTCGIFSIAQKIKRFLPHLETFFAPRGAKRRLEHPKSRFSRHLCAQKALFEKFLIQFDKLTRRGGCGILKQIKYCN